MRVPYKKIVESYANKLFSGTIQCKVGEDVFTRYGSIINSGTGKEEKEKAKKKKMPPVLASSD